MRSIHEHRPARAGGRLCRAQLARGRDADPYTTACLVVALTLAGSGDAARTTANGLIDAAEATRNPFVLSFALLAYGLAFREADPAARSRRCVEAW